MLLARGLDGTPRPRGWLLLGSFGAYAGLSIFVARESPGVVGAAAILLATWVGIASLFSP
jgi:hypothetical protein